MEENDKGKGLDMAQVYIIAFEILLLGSLYRTSLPAIRGSNIEHWSKLASDRWGYHVPCEHLPQSEHLAYTALQREANTCLQQCTARTMMTVHNSHLNNHHPDCEVTDIAEQSHSYRALCCE